MDRLCGYAERVDWIGGSPSHAAAGQHAADCTRQNSPGASLHIQQQQQQINNNSQ